MIFHQDLERDSRKGRRRRLKVARGRALEKEKPPIFGMLQRGGEVVVRMLENVQQPTIKGVGIVYAHKPRRDIPYGYIPGFRQAFPLFPSFVMQQAQFALPGQIPACPAR